MEKAKEYSYSFWVTFVSLANVLWSALAGLALLVVSIDVLISHSYRLIPDTWEVTKFHPWAGIPAGLFLCMMSLVGAASCNRILVVETGVKVKIFHLFWHYIPWEDVEGIVPLMNSYTGLAKTQIVKLKRLTLVHRLIGLSMLTKPIPVLVIHSHIRQYWDLVDIIRSHSE